MPEKKICKFNKISIITIKQLIYDAANNGVTVFVTTHYMDEAEYCDRVSIMDKGKIVALDKPENLKKQYNAKNMDEVFVKIAR